MDVKTFATLLARSLVNKGIPKDIAVKHAVSLVRTFDEEDLSEIASYTREEEFSELTNSLADLIRDKEKLPPAPGQEKESAPGTTTVFDAVEQGGERRSSYGDTRSIPRVTVGSDDSDVRRAEKMKTRDFVAVSDPMGENMKTRPFGVVNDPVGENMKTRPFGVINDPVGENMKTKPFGVVNDPVGENMKTKAFVAKDEPSTRNNGATQTFESVKAPEALRRADADTIEVNAVSRERDEEQEIYLNEAYAEEKVVLTKRGRAFFIGITLAASPVILTVALLVLGVFAVGILAVCALVLFALLLVCSEAVLGSGLTLVGIIYGAIEIISGNVGAGIYEIGLGTCCGGVFLAIGILTYNFAVLVLPYCLKQLISFEGYCLKRVGPMLNRFRRECNKL